VADLEQVKVVPFGSKFFLEALELFYFTLDQGVLFVQLGELALMLLVHEFGFSGYSLFALLRRSNHLL